MDAILFTTNTGSTERYANLLSQATELPAYSLARARREVLPDAEVNYLGWIRAGKVIGYAAAARRYMLRAVCAVGMGQTGAQAESVRNKTRIPADVPLFTLQGGFDVRKLHGFYRLAMEMMVRTAGKGLAQKEDRSPVEDDMLDLMVSGGDRVSMKNLRTVLDWCQNQGLYGKTGGRG